MAWREVTTKYGHTYLFVFPLTTVGFALLTLECWKLASKFETDPDVFFSPHDAEMVVLSVSNSLKKKLNPA
jgi:hypothetical protein